jgi:cell division transport system permease protein
MGAWLTRHVQTFVGALGRLGQQPIATLMTMMVIGIALALPTCLHLLIINAKSVSAHWDKAVDLSVYLKIGTPERVAQSLLSRVQARRDVASVRLITADEGLKEFARDLGFAEAVKALEENPLPHTLVVTPRADNLTTEHLESLAADLRELPEVELVQLDTAWVRRLQAILDALQRAVLAAAALLALGVVLIVGNTIRLDIYGRRAEIEITKLVGGSNGFVRRPFLYAGVWYGLGGALLAALLTFVIIAVLSGPIARIASAYASTFRLQGLDAPTLLVLLGAGIALGWLGSFLSASRHLHEIEPR